jgi:hypothetical protein
VIPSSGPFFGASIAVPCMITPLKALDGVLSVANKH